MFYVFYAPTTAEITYLKISQLSPTHNRCNQHHSIPLGKSVKPISTKPLTGDRKHKQIWKKPTITTKENSRLESNFLLWFILIILSHTKCYQPNFFRSKQFTPLHDRKLIGHSCFLPNQDHTTIP